MGTVTFRVTNVPNRAATVRQALPFAVVDGQDCILKSPLAEDVPLSDHLVWIWGILKHGRRRLKSLQADGAQLFIEARGFRGDVELRPNGAEMLHLLNASLKLKAR